MAGHVLDNHDVAALQEAASLIQDVPRRHPRQLSGPILTAVQTCVHNITALRRYLEEAR
jgi:hypothetical protein